AADVGAEPFAGGTLVLVDTSASRALGFGEEASLVEGLAHEVAASAGPSAHLVVAAFDQDVAMLFDGEAGGYNAQSTSKLLARGALGASDLEDALRWAAKNVHGMRRVVVVSDGVATAGSLDGAKLAAAARGLRDVGVERVDAVAVGGIRDEVALARLTSGALPREGIVVDGTHDVHAIARRLTRGARSGIAVQVEGASWVWPEHLDGVQPGDERLVYAEVPEGAPVRMRIGDGALGTPALREMDKPLLGRAWAQAKIASVLARAESAKDASAHARVVELSTRYRVLSPYTSLLVLETDADYARFKIDRKAPGDILAIRGSRVVLEHRGEARVALAAPAPGRMMQDARNADKTSEKDESGTLAPADLATATAAAPSPPPPMRGPMGAGQKASASDEMPSETERAPMSQAAAAPEPANAPPSLASRPQRATIDRDDPMPRSAGQGAASGLAVVARPEEDGIGKIAPYTGKFRTVMDAIGRKNPAVAVETAAHWHEKAPGDVMALVALGEALEASGDLPRAARSYGSLIDLFPARADLRRFAGERLERVRAEGALELAIDSYAKAEEERPDHPASHRLLAFARLRKGDFAGAFDAAVAGVKRRYPEGRFAGVDRILREDLGLIAAAWIHAEPARKDEISTRLREAGGSVEDRPSIRFILNWETDANDVDFHILDAKGGHAYYGRRHLESGGDLYADVTTGYGPECFTIRAPRGGRAAPYKLRAHYFSRGPMGYGMGKLEILDHDGHGGITFEERPFVVMADGAFVDLGTVK
ncbi:MAG TPA: hypothetical protein VNO21_24765, partial [Polyangiaceae bacterium]|nr:hypothetical protein [Polyangiaceae bacterium]